MILQSRSLHYHPNHSIVCNVDLQRQNKTAAAKQLFPKLYNSISVYYYITTAKDKRDARYEHSACRKLIAYPALRPVDNVLVTTSATQNVMICCVV